MFTWLFSSLPFCEIKVLAGSWEVLYPSTLPADIRKILPSGVINYTADKKLDPWMITGIKTLMGDLLLKIYFPVFIIISV